VEAARSPVAPHGFRWAAFANCHRPAYLPGSSVFTGIKMFTGIVTALGAVRAVTPLGNGQDMRLVIAAPWPDTAGIPLGASIACSGCCLTATELGPDWFAADASAETLACTTLGRWRVGTRVNLERSLRLGDEMGGHIVSGHVDGVGQAVSATPENASTRWVFRVPAGLARFIAVKGSIAVDGVSLTVNEVHADTFGVNVISHTAQVTGFGLLAPGDTVNIEIDMLARYVARLAETA
jgi:riboflavin synthase